MKKIYGIFLIVLVLTSCFNALDEDKGIITLHLGGGSTARNLTDRPDTNIPFGDIVYRIILTPESGADTVINTAAGQTTVNAEVETGVWRMKVYAFLGDDTIKDTNKPYGISIDSETLRSIVVRAGRATPVTVKMERIVVPPKDGIHINLWLENETINYTTSPAEDAGIITISKSSSNAGFLMFTVTSVFSRILWTVDGELQEIFPSTITGMGGGASGFIYAQNLPVGPHWLTIIVFNQQGSPFDTVIPFVVTE